MNKENYMSGRFNYLAFIYSQYSSGGNFFLLHVQSGPISESSCLVFLLWIGGGMGG